MKMESKRDYLNDLRDNYLKCSKKGKGELLDGAEKTLDLSRKHIIRQLSVSNDLKRPITRSREKYYTDDLKAPLAKIWEIFNCPCSVALKEIVINELSRLRNFHINRVSELQAKKLQQMSARTMEKMLTHEKNKAKDERRSNNAKNNPLLMQKIKTKMSCDYDRDKTGYIQLDAVEHAGESASGEYAITISSIDVGSYWFEAEAIMGKGQQRTLKAINNLRVKMPGAWKEIHPDNGSNFINYHLYQYTKETNLTFTRSRAYKKNDNCFVEQSNGAVIRQSVGYLRYDTEEEITQLNEIYELTSLYRNFFHPVLRIKIKERNKGHITRRYYPPKTPYQWLMESDEITNEQKKVLRKKYKNLNPLQLKRKLEEAVTKLFRLNKEKKMKAKTKIKKSNSVSSLIAQQPHFRCAT
jgi:hypothetical protein